MNILDENGNLIKVPEEDESGEGAATEAVNGMLYEEISRRQWCVSMSLQAYNLETTESNFTRIADKIYDYVYGKKQP